MGPTRQQVLQVSVLLFGCLLSELNYTLLAPALPVIMGDMHVGETDVQWLMSVYALVEAVVIPLNAFFLGRFTTRRLFAGSFLLFAAGSAVIAAGPGFAQDGKVGPGWRLTSIFLTRTSPLRYQLKLLDL